MESCFRKLLLLSLVTGRLDILHAAVCFGGLADLVFVVDSSGSVGQDNFDVMLQFASNITQSLYVWEAGVHVGFVRFASAPDVIFHLNTYVNRYQVMDAIEEVRYNQGRTKTHMALRMLREEVFNSSYGGRVSADVPQIGLILTDGKSNQPQETVKEAQVLRDAGVTLLAVGVGKADVDELAAIATEPTEENAFHVTDFASISSIEETILGKICGASAGDFCDDSGECRSGSSCVAVSVWVLALLLVSSLGLYTTH